MDEIRLDKSILDRVKKNDEEAFNILRETYRKRLFLFAMTVVSNAEDAHQVVENTFKLMIHEMPKITDSNRLNVKIFQICYRQGMKCVKQREDH